MYKYEAYNLYLNTILSACQVRGKKLSQVKMELKQCLPFILKKTTFSFLCFDPLKKRTNYCGKDGSQHCC